MVWGPAQPDRISPATSPHLAAKATSGGFSLKLYSLGAAQTPSGSLRRPAEPWKLRTVRLMHIVVTTMNVGK